MALHRGGAAGGEGEVGPLGERDAVQFEVWQAAWRVWRRDVKRLTAVTQGADQFQGDPAAAVARAADRVQAVAAELGDRRWIQDRDACGRKRVFLLERHGGGLGLMVLAGQDHHGAMSRRAAEVAVLATVATPA